MTSPAPPAPPDPGSGVFETIRAEGSEARYLADHLARLRASVRALYAVELGDELEACAAAALVTAPDRAARRLRVMATPSPPDVVLRASLAPLGAAAERSTVALRAWTVPGGLGPHKWIDRRGIDAAAARLGATPLIVEADSEVLEAAWANVWALEAARLLTPPADGRILPGVTRARLLAIGGDVGLQAVEERLSLERLARADAIVLTSSLRLAVPGRLASEPGRRAAEVAEAIAAALRERAT
jgi:para-aminobenzoate synthetase / 4-amino-4-deoxychorismate lyase